MAWICDMIAVRESVVGGGWWVVVEADNSGRGMGVDWLLSDVGPRSGLLVQGFDCGRA